MPASVLPPFEPGLIYCRQSAYPDFTYINRPEDRQAIDRDGLVAVGDVGYFDRDGYLYICDRKSDMVISGGVNIYPAEIEAVLITMPRRRRLRGVRHSRRRVRRGARRARAAA